jgi:hypothetical protein
MGAEHVHAAVAGTACAPELFGFLVEFDDVRELLAAAERVRDAGYTKWDVHTPFPVRGLDEAMGIRPTILPWAILAGGAIGCGSALLLQWYCNAYDYPLITSGKPFFSLPANIPVIFELTVLLAAITAFLGLLMANRLPELYHPVFTSPRFRRATTDRFFIVVEAADPQFDSDGTRGLLASLGGVVVEEVRM